MRLVQEVEKSNWLLVTRGMRFPRICRANCEQVEGGVWNGLWTSKSAGARSAQGKIQPLFLPQHEGEKKRCYNARVLNVEKATFTHSQHLPIAISGEEAEAYHKRLATLIATKRGQLYSDVMSFLRRRLRFCILRSCLAAIRGYRGRPCYVDTEADINLDGRCPPYSTGKSGEISKQICYRGFLTVLGPLACPLWITNFSKIFIVEKCHFLPLFYHSFTTSSFH